MLAIERDEDRAMAGVWLDFVGLARVSPALAEIHCAGWAQLRAAFARLVGLAHPGHPAPAEAAETVLAVCDGIAIARVVESDFMTGERAGAIVERVLAVIAAEAEPGAG